MSDIHVFIPSADNPRFCEAPCYYPEKDARHGLYQTAPAEQYADNDVGGGGDLIIIDDPVRPPLTENQRAMLDHFRPTSSDVHQGPMHEGDIGEVLGFPSMADAEQYAADHHQPYPGTSPETLEDEEPPEQFLVTPPQLEQVAQEVVNGEVRPYGPSLYDHNCTLCPLHARAKTVCVAGTGSLDADIMIVGANPGAQEDRDGVPFVGPAGQLLDRLLLEAGISHERVFITNAAKCVTPSNRAPSKKELAVCSAAYLVQEISRVRPKVIVPLGNTPLHALTGEGSITKKRGKEQQFSGSFEAALVHEVGWREGKHPDPTEKFPANVKIIPTFHPAVVLHEGNESKVKQIVDDLRVAAGYLDNSFADVSVGWGWFENAAGMELDTFAAQVRASLAGLTDQLWSFDLETNGYEVWDPRFRIAMLAIDNGYEKVTVFRGTACRFGIEALRVAKECGVTLVGHNGSGYDRPGIEARVGINLRCEDTMLIAHLLDEEGPKGLQDLAVRHLGVAPWKDVDFEWRRFTEGPFPTDEEWARLGLYNARDTRYTRLLYQKQRPQLDADAPLANYYTTFCLPLSRALSVLERNGAYCSIPAVGEAMGTFVLQRLRAESQARALVDDPKFNPGSPKQVKEILFDRLALPAQGWTDGGDESTNELALKKLKYQVLTDMPHPPAVAVPLIDAILSYREAVKMLGTYLEKYAERAMSDADSRLHYWYSLIGSVSRTSSDGQQLPRDPRVRSIIAAAPGKVLVQADFSQLELRIAAHLSGDENLRAAYERGDDVHMLLAQRIKAMRGDTHAVTEEERSRAKPGNFLLVYGGDEYTFENTVLKDYDLIVPRQESSLIVKGFHTQWPGLSQTWYPRVFRETQAQGYVRSQSGRVRRLPAINSSDIKLRTEALRQAVNFQDQELGLVIAGIGLILAVGWGLFVTRFIHDSIDVECDPADVPAVTAQLKQIETLVPAILRERFGIEFSVPLVLDVKVKS